MKKIYLSVEVSPREMIDSLFEAAGSGKLKRDDFTDRDVEKLGIVVRLLGRSDKNGEE